jgi:2',3'-cyclic-nucleotide 2'-phosphodiesterase (5'-nucleotidase family)
MYKYILYIPFTVLIAAASAAPVHAGAPRDTVHLVILSTTDVHGWILPWDYYTDAPEERYGLAKAATLIDSIRGVHEHTILLDAGDWLQGNPLAEYFGRVDTAALFPFLQIADHLEYDALVLGNHEFDFSVELLEKRISETQTPILGANINRSGTADPAYPIYIIKNFDSLSVGVIGLTTPGTAVWNRPRVESRFDFIDGTDAAMEFVPLVKNEGADVVIVLAHSGLESGSSYHADDVPEENFGRRIGETVPGVDHLVLGHAHRVIEGTSLTGADGRNVGVIMPGRWASHLGVSELTLVFDPADERWHVAAQTTKALPVRNVHVHDEVAELAANAHNRVRDYYTQPIAHTAAEWNAERARLEDTPIIDLIQHVQKKATGAQLSAAAAFNTQTAFGPGGITRGQLAQLYPYENTLYMLEVTGKQIRKFLEHSSRHYLESADAAAPAINPDVPGFNYDMLSGVEYTLDLRRAVGERVIDLRYNNRPVMDDDTFTLAVNSYRAQGGGGFDMLENAPILLEINRSVRDLIADFLIEKGEIQPGDIFEKNWRFLHGE